MATAAELNAAREHKRASYTVRTRFVDDRGEPTYINHLIQADSPYLLQHAHNPVEWYPWGDEAFAKAARENKPVFLSIGYSTCHWCHVMEEESFDDAEVAERLNTDFVAIKVDREQRPDLDEVYMTGVQLMTGRGGWPMSCLLTPEGKLFFGGTYLPKTQFLALLDRASQAWRERQDKLRADADTIDQSIRRQLAPAKGAELPEDLIEQVTQALMRQADPDHGGFGDAPKFPQEPNLRLLLEQVQRDERPLADQPLWSVVRNALDAMRQGGIYDQIGGGFHRYATDRAWRVPHFEKMLYNQGQLASVYLWAWQLSGQPEYRRVVEETLDYLLREMQAPDGGFYSATDADSEGEEGRYFVWHYDELAEALDDHALAVCETVYGVTRGGNFEGANVLHLSQSLDEAAQELGLSRDALDQALADIKQRLYDLRSRRHAPLRDDKQITEWNGMAIVALAEAGRALGRADYRRAASDAADHIWHQHHDEGHGLLWRASLEGAASVPAQLEDYAHLINALVALYDATAETRWLTRARTLLDEARSRHWDADGGGFFVAPAGAAGPQLLRSKSLLDGATISGNSLMVAVLIALHARTGAPDLRALAERQIAAFSGHITELPLAGPVFLQGVCQWHSPTPGPLQYMADGAIRVQCTAASGADRHVRATVTLDIQPGWHIPQHPDDAPEAMRLGIRNNEHWSQERVDYPVLSDTSNSDPAPAATAAMTLTARGSPATPLVLELQLQPCTQSECLPVQRRMFVLHAAGQG